MYPISKTKDSVFERTIKEGIAGLLWAIQLHELFVSRRVRINRILLYSLYV